jgi:WD40 repeat protein
MRYHQNLSNYFLSKPAYLDSSIKKIPNRRKLIEMPWQYVACNDVAGYMSIVFDFGFLQAKTVAGLVQDLINDYSLPDNKLGEYFHLHEIDQLQSISLTKNSLMLSLGVISKDPSQLCGQLIGRMAHVTMPEVKRLIMQARESIDFSWLEPLNCNLVSPGTGIIYTLKGHAKYITSFSISEEGNRALSSSEYGTLKVWDLQSGLELKSINGHINYISTSIISADGRKALSASSLVIKVWDLDSGAEIFSLYGHHYPVTHLFINWNGQKAISVSEEGCLKFWNLQTGAEIRSIYSKRKIIRIKIDANGENAILNFRDSKTMISSIHIVNLKTGYELCELVTQKEEIVSFEISRKGHFALLAYKDGSVQYMDLTRERENKQILAGGECYVYSISLAPDDRNALIQFNNGNIQWWDIRIVQLIASFNNLNKNIDGFLFHSGEWKIFTKDEYVIHALYLSKILHSSNFIGHLSDVFNVSISHDGKKTVSSADDRTIKLWDENSKNEIHSAKLNPPYGANPIEISPNVSFFISGLEKNGILISDIENYTKISSIPGEDRIITNEFTKGDLFGIYTLFQGVLKALTITQDSKWAIGASADRAAFVWDLINMKQIHTFEEHDYAVLAVAVTSDKRRLFSASGNLIKIWDIQKEQLILSIQTGTDVIRSIALTSDEKIILSSSNNSILGWDVKIGAKVITLIGHSSKINMIKTSTRAPLAISASDDGSVKVWDLNKKSCAASFTGESPMTCCAITPDGKKIIAGERSGRIHLLNFKDLNIL